MLIVLTGIDGSGKTTAAEATVAAARQAGTEARLFRNYAGRRRMSLLGARLGVQLPPRAADVIESAVRTFNVLNSHRRARKFHTLVVMDRHLHCQLALRGMHGLPRGRFIPWLIRTLPAPDLVIYLDIEPREAHARILARATDAERLEDLVSLRDAYRSLPEFSGFTHIPAGGSTGEVLSLVQAAISGAGRQRKECGTAGPVPAVPASSGSAPGWSAPADPASCGPASCGPASSGAGPVPSGPDTPRAGGALPRPAPGSCRCPWPCPGTSGPWS